MKYSLPKKHSLPKMTAECFHHRRIPAILKATDLRLSSCAMCLYFSAFTHTSVPLGLGLSSHYDGTCSGSDFSSHVR